MNERYKFTLEQRKFTLEQRVWFFGIDVHSFLDNCFLGWIGSQGAVEWPIQSSDMTPCDFSLWDILKDKVFLQHLRAINELKSVVEAEVDLQADKGLLDRTCRQVTKLCGKVIEAGGRHIEHLL